MDDFFADVNKDAHEYFENDLETVRCQRDGLRLDVARLTRERDEARADRDRVRSRVEHYTGFSGFQIGLIEGVDYLGEMMRLRERQRDEARELLRDIAEYKVECRYGVGCEGHAIAGMAAAYLAKLDKEGGES